MAGKDWRGPSPRSGMACRSNAAPCTSIGTCSPIRPSVCTRRSPPTTRTCFTPRHRHRSRAAARPSSASGGSSVGRWPIASKKPAIASSPSRGYRRANGAAPGPPMRSSVCTKSSSDGSRRRRCCRQLRQPRCCFGRCSLPARSTCERLTVGGRLPKHPSVSQLTSRPDSVLSKCRRSRHPIPTQIATAPVFGSLLSVWIAENHRPSVHGELAQQPRTLEALSSVLVAVSAILLTSVVLLAVDSFLDAKPLIFVYLLPTVVIAMHYGSTLAVLTSFASGLAAAYFFFPPKFSFYIADPLNVAELGFFLLLAAIASKAVAAVTHDARASKAIRARARSR